MYKEAYPPGTRVMLLDMGTDPYSVEDNTRGTVRFVDNIGTLHCSFDNGRSLGIVPSEDSFRRLTAEELAEEQENRMDEVECGPVTPDVVLFSTSVRCRLIAAVVAASFQTSVLTDASAISYDGKVASQRMVYGGSAVKTEQSRQLAVVCLSAGSYEPTALPENPQVIERSENVNTGICCTGVEKKVVEGVDLASAKKVVCVGRGCSSEIGLQNAARFAELTGCEVGCTRPVSEDGLMGASKYVGISGVMMKPDVYFGFGISGQVQHLVGINQAKVIFVVNKDKDAPFFKNADYGLVGDAEVVLPKLIAMLEA